MSNGNEPLHTEVDEVLDNDSFYQQECDERDKHWWEHQDRSMQMANQVTGILTNAQLSKSGKSISCTLNSNYYSCKEKEIESLVGQELICDTSVQQMKDGGSITWINAFQVNGEPTKSNGAPTKSNGASSISAGIDLPLPFISNTVATAISAGLIKKPEDIESWVVGCHRAVTYLSKKEIGSAVKEATDSLKSQEADVPF